MRKTYGVAMAAACALSSPALADDYYAVTPSGATEEIFAGPPEETIGKLSSRCIDAKWTVVSSSATELVREAPMNIGQSVLGQMLMGNSYSTPPRRYFRFNAATVNGVSRVQASGWMELQMALGQTKRTDFSGPAFHNNIMTFMSSAGGQFPVGTTFPHHVFLGAGFEEARIGKTIGLRITKLEADGPGARAGLQVGDTITNVAGKKFKDIGDLLDAFAKATKTPTYGVDVVRAGKSMSVTVERAYRSPWTEAVVATPSRATALASATPIPPISVADELAKLAKLKSDGVLTDAEFEAQKRKLLAP